MPIASFLTIIWLASLLASCIGTEPHAGVYNNIHPHGPNDISIVDNLGNQLDEPVHHEQDKETPERRHSHHRKVCDCADIINQANIGFINRIDSYSNYTTSKLFPLITELRRDMTNINHTVDSISLKVSDTKKIVQLLNSTLSSHKISASKYGHLIAEANDINENLGAVILRALLTQPEVTRVSDAICNNLENYHNEKMKEICRKSHASRSIFRGRKTNFRSDIGLECYDSSIEDIASDGVCNLKTGDKIWTIKAQRYSPYIKPPDKYHVFMDDPNIRKGRTLKSITNYSVTQPTMDFKSVLTIVKTASSAYIACRYPLCSDLTEIDFELIFTTPDKVKDLIASTIGNAQLALSLVSLIVGPIVYIVVGIICNKMRGVKDKQIQEKVIFEEAKPIEKIKEKITNIPLAIPDSQYVSFDLIPDVPGSITASLHNIMKPKLIMSAMYTNMKIPCLRSEDLWQPFLTTGALGKTTPLDTAEVVIGVELDWESHEGGLNDLKKFVHGKLDEMNDIPEVISYSKQFTHNENLTWLENQTGERSSETLFNQLLMDQVLGMYRGLSKLAIHLSTTDGKGGYKEKGNFRLNNFFGTFSLCSLTGTCPPLSVASLGKKNFVGLTFSVEGRVVARFPSPWLVENRPRFRTISLAVLSMSNIAKHGAKCQCPLHQKLSKITEAIYALEKATTESTFYKLLRAGLKKMNDTKKNAQMASGYQQLVNEREAEEQAKEKNELPVLPPDLDTIVLNILRKENPIVDTYNMENDDYKYWPATSSVIGADFDSLFSLGVKKEEREKKDGKPMTATDMIAKIEKYMAQAQKQKATELPAKMINSGDSIASAVDNIIMKGQIAESHPMWIPRQQV